MTRLCGALVITSAAWLLGSAAPPDLTADTGLGPTDAIAPVVETAAATPVVAPKEVPMPQSPSVERALAQGVLMVVSIPDQRIHVFKNGTLWDSARVSTGKRGHSTPVGVFPILQKSAAHRSSLYNDAPMPYMQRLTWGGVALHGGNITRARASHGCIRLPHAFARRLFAITSFRSTAVLITEQAAPTADRALAIAGGDKGRGLPVASAVQLAAALPASARAPLKPTQGEVRTIQLAASSTSAGAQAIWSDLVERRPELSQLGHRVEPAVVNARQVYRLRATGAGAENLCRKLSGSGIACFRVTA